MPLAGWVASFRILPGLVFAQNLTVNRLSTDGPDNVTHCGIVLIRIYNRIYVKLDCLIGTLAKEG